MTEGAAHLRAGGQRTDTADRRARAPPLPQLRQDVLEARSARRRLVPAVEHQLVDGRRRVVGPRQELAATHHLHHLGTAVPVVRLVETGPEHGQGKRGALEVALRSQSNVSSSMRVNHNARLMAFVGEASQNPHP